MNVSEFIFDFFVKKNINTVFTVTGGHSMYLNDAMFKNKNLNIVCNHHEQASAMAASTYGKVKNYPAVAVVTAGPGATNAITGVAGAYLDSSPMFIISGQTGLNYVKYEDSTQIRQYGTQGISIGPIVKKIVKYFITVDDAQNVEYYLEKAYKEAMTGRPGPVWLEVPLDIQRSEVNLSFLKKYTDEKGEHLEKNKKIVEEIRSFLKESKRPLIIAGNGINLSNSRNEFNSMVKKLKIPVVTSRLGLDIIDSDNEYYIGRPGNSGERSANFAIQNADLLLILGSRMSSATIGHNSNDFGRNAKKIIIDIDEEELKKPGLKYDVVYKVDCKNIINLINENLSLDNLYNKKEWIEYCRMLKRKYPVVLDEYKREIPINSYYFTDKLSKEASNNDIITVDAGTVFYVACQTWKVKYGQRFLPEGGFSAMGAWCGSIGAAMSDKEKNIIVLTGDGSFQMNIQELATIKYNSLKLKIFVYNNNGYLAIRNTQRNFMEDRFIGEGKSSGLWFPDSLCIAKAYGIKGVRIDSGDDMEEKIKEVLEYDGPVICDVIVQEWQVLQPRVSSEKLADGTLVSRKYEDMFPFLPKEEYEENMIAEK